MTLARVLRVPYPVFLVLGGLAIGAVPGMPEVTLDPDLVLLLFLPPLLYVAAFWTSLRELRANVRPIGMLAIGLVLTTCVAVAVVAHAVIDGLSWPAAFLLGAIVSPTDPVAATSIASRLGVPQRVVTIVEGESLINDATALVAYKVALAAVVTGSFSLADASGRFVLGAIAGVAIGLAVGWVVAHVRERLDDPPVEITISMLTGYLAYLPAEELGASGVLAAVTVGLFMGSQTSRVTNATVRLQTGPVWEILAFLLNSFLFVLIGLQLPRVLDGLRGTGYSGGELIGWAAGATLAVMVVRLLTVFAFAPLMRDRPSHREVAVIGWMGMRGAVSLAAALAIPLTIDAGSAFPHRELITWLVFSVILGTLVLQGLSLPAVVRALAVHRDEEAERAEEDIARQAAARAALERIDELDEEDWPKRDSLERIRALYDYRHRRFSARLDEGDDGGLERRSASWARMAHAVIDAQRHAIDQMRRDGSISDAVMRRVERDLDLEEQRLLTGRQQD